MKPKHIVDCNLDPLCRCHARRVVENGSKPARRKGFVGKTLLVLDTAFLVGAPVLLMTFECAGA